MSTFLITLCRSKLMTSKKLFSQISKTQGTQLPIVRHSSSALNPPVPWLGKPSCVFSTQAVKHHWGALPIIIISAVCLGMEILCIARCAVSRDDVYYTKTAACDIIETREGYKPPVRKWMVINQKFENPPGLIDALRGRVKDETGETTVEESSSSFNKKLIAANVLSSAAVIYWAMFM